MSPEAVSYAYQIDLIRSADGQHLGRHSVPDAYLENAREQTMFDGQRRGVLGGELSGVRVVDQPVYASNNGGAGETGAAVRPDPIRGVLMRVGEGSQRVDKVFGLGLFEPFASAVTRRLVQAQRVHAEDLVTYEVFARRARPVVPHDGVVAQVCRQPLALSEGRLGDWLAAGRADGPIGQGDYPLFMLEKEVLEAARTMSWRGKGAEGGCWLVGNLYRQSTPKPEIFGVIHTVFRAVGCKHDRFGLEPSSETYVQLQDQLQRRRRRGRAGELAMGFCHSHPFSPSELLGHEACANCDKQATCDLSSAFLSGRDARFHRAVFGRSPYTVELVLGLTPRGEFDLRVYCLDGGQFRRRGSYRVAGPPLGALGATR